MLKRLSMIAAVLVLFVAFGSAAQAQQYPPASNVLSAEVDVDATCHVTVTMTARTYRPGSSVSFTLFSDPVRLGSVTADGSGIATLARKLPENTTLGTHTLEASGIAPDGSPLKLASTLRFQCDTRAAVASTGSNSIIPLTRAGVAAVAGGALLVLAARKRRRRVTA